MLYKSCTCCLICNSCTCPLRYRHLLNAHHLNAHQAICHKYSMYNCLHCSIVTLEDDGNMQFVYTCSCKRTYNINVYFCLKMFKHDLFKKFHHDFLSNLTSFKPCGKFSLYLEHIWKTLHIMHSWYNPNYWVISPSKHEHRCKVKCNFVIFIWNRLNYSHVDAWLKAFYIKLILFAAYFECRKLFLQDVMKRKCSFCTCDTLCTVQFYNVVHLILYCFEKYIYLTLRTIKMLFYSMCNYLHLCVCTLTF